MKARTLAMKDFRENSDINVMVLTTKAGGLGLNLQVADTAILFDTDWNPQADVQATNRVHRIGQERPVLVIRLMTPTAMDRGLLERSNRKLDIERKVIAAGDFHKEDGSAVDQDPERQRLLHQLVREARDRKIGSKSVGLKATPLNEVNELISRSDSERVAFDAADLETLGPPESDDTLEMHLERAGRLITAAEVRRSSCSKGQQLQASGARAMQRALERNPSKSKRKRARRQ